MALPARNNLKTIRYWLGRICRWIAEKRVVYEENLTAEQLEAIDNLVAACEGVIAFINILYPPNS